MEKADNTEKTGTFNYGGIFLSCFEEYADTKCIHSMPDHVLVYLYSGEQVINDGEKDLVIHAGECAFIRRDHRIVINKNSYDGKPYKGISLAFKRNLLREFYTAMNKSDVPDNVSAPGKSVFHLEARPDIISLFESLTPYFDSGVEPSDDIVKLKLEEGIYALLKTSKEFYPILFDFTTPWKIDILEFLNQNYMYQLTMEEIASYTGRSLATFKRDFAKISDVSPQKWLMNKRLHIAHEKIQEQNKKASDVYVEVGFKNLSHFYTAYKKLFGFSPGR